MFSPLSLLFFFDAPLEFGLRDTHDFLHSLGEFVELGIVRRRLHGDMIRRKRSL